ncbi:MAG: 50S ribosomal protein L13 [Chromatiales bacterium]|nr:50S ribosomal protein L13 [Chromatiales bacterium]
MKTYSAKAKEIKRNWYVVDASGQPLGRLASEIAKRLRGKHKPQYTPHVDVGDHIIVINATQVAVSGNKMRDKIYYRHSGYTGSIKSQSLEKLLAEHPERVIENAIRGMLPKNPLGRAMFRKLRVYAGSDYQQTAQQPQALRI